MTFDLAPYRHAAEDRGNPQLATRLFNGVIRRRGITSEEGLVEYITENARFHHDGLRVPMDRNVGARTWELAYDVLDGHHGFRKDDFLSPRRRRDG